MQRSIAMVEEHDRVPAGNPAAVAEVTELATRYLAAHVIAHPRFPERAVLPGPRPAAFTNFGHQPMVDYERLVNIVWQVALEASAVAKRTWGNWKFALYLTGFSLGGLSIALYGLNGFGYCVALGLILRVIKGRFDRSARRVVADVRATALNQLAQQRFEQREPAMAVKVWAEQLGTGELGSGPVPVLTLIDPAQPFPGFGDVQGETLFVCRPKSDGDPVASADLAPRIYAQIVASVRRQPEVEFRDGEVIVVDGATLSMQSPWLGADRAPRLWLPREELSRVHDLDPRASVRVFHACQLVSLRHATTATVFVRVFPAGNAIAFHIAVTTLGPPKFGLESLVARVLKHQVEREDRRWFARWRALLPRARTPDERHDIAHLQPADAANRESLPFEGELDIDEVVKLDPGMTAWRDPRGAHERLVARIAAESALWPGRLIARRRTLREGRSHDMTPDFFGRPEALALIRTVYNQVTRAVLEAFDHAGYDISDYRDRDGRFTIHADQIGQLVLGEQVNISQGNKSATRSGQTGKGSAGGKANP
jgi:hypothetical protein